MSKTGPSAFEIARANTRFGDGAMSRGDIKIILSALAHAERLIDVLCDVSLQHTDNPSPEAMWRVREGIEELNLETAPRLELERALERSPRATIETLTRAHLSLASSAARRHSEWLGSALDSASSGRPLTSEQYHLVRAMGVTLPSAKTLGLAQIADHELLDNLFYEDEDWHGWINPAPLPIAPPERIDADGTSTSWVRTSWGRPPEECWARALRGEQRRFFKTHLPELLPRFKGG